MEATVLSEVAPQPTLTPGESRHLAALERRIERGLQTFHEVGTALLEIRDKRLFRLTHPTFEAYCRERWGLERARAYQLMGAAEVVSVLGDGGGPFPVNEAQARELVPVFHHDPSLVPEVWEEVSRLGRPVTAPLIREVVKRRTSEGDFAARPAVEVIEPTATDRLIAAINRVKDEATRWRTSKPNIGERTRVRRAADEFVEAVKG